MYTPISRAAVSVLFVRSICHLSAENLRVRDKAIKRAYHIRRSFERPVPEYSVLTKLVLFFFANASPHWTIFATFS
jgi:hypothetical protein